MFYLAMYAICVALKSARPRRPTISALDVGIVTDSVLQESYEHVSARYQKLGGDDKVAKGTALAETLKQDLRSRFGAKKKKTP